MREWKRFFLLVSQYMSSMCMRIFWNDHVCQWRYIFRYISKYHIILFLKKMWPHEDHFMPFVFMDFTFIYSCSLFHTICFILPTRLHFFYLILFHIFTTSICCVYFEMTIYMLYVLFFRHVCTFFIWYCFTFSPHQYVFHNNVCISIFTIVR